MYQAFALAYDQLMDDVDYDAWCAYYMRILSLAGQPHPRGAADICCGTGQFTVRLAAKGIRVTGVDLSPDMLAVAQENARARGFSALPFVCMDASRFTLHRPVDAILCACDGVNYMASPYAVRSFFTRAFMHLKPGGVLAFDVSTPYKLSRVLGGNTFGEDRESISYLWRNRFDPQSALCEMELTLFFRDEDGRYTRFAERHIQRAHTADELTAWLSQAGFLDIRLYSGQTEEPPRPEDHRIHITAVRSEDWHGG